LAPFYFQNPDKKPISGDTLTKAMSALGAFLNLREFGERVFNDLSDTWLGPIPGLPDFSRHFIPKKLPNNHKIYPRRTNYTKWP
jgi:hypothetical protein